MCGKLTILFISLTVLTMGSAGAFGYFIYPTGQHRSYSTEQGDTVDLGTYDSSRYSKIDVSSLLNDSMITVYSRSMTCHKIPVYPNTTYHIEGSLQLTSLLANDQQNWNTFSHGLLCPQLNTNIPTDATGSESLNKSKCSAAFVIFDSQTDYDNFLHFGNNTARRMKHICFDVFTIFCM